MEWLPPASNHVVHLANELGLDYRGVTSDEAQGRHGKRVSDAFLATHANVLVLVHLPDEPTYSEDQVDKLCHNMMFMVKIKST